jgi:hypothetical protein
VRKEEQSFVLPFDHPFVVLLFELWSSYGDRCSSMKAIFEAKK